MLVFSHPLFIRDNLEQFNAVGYSRVALICHGDFHQGLLAGVVLMSLLSSSKVPRAQLHFPIPLLHSRKFHSFTAEIR